MVDSKNPQGHKVTLHLLNGEEILGYLVSFSPKKHRFSFQTEAGNMQFIDVSEIAHIGFYKSRGQNDSHPKPKDTEPYIVHTLTNKQIHILAVGLKAYHNGFFAFPEQDNSPFTHYYFYRRGIRLLEQSKPLGQLMVQAQDLSEDDINKADRKSVV